MNACAGPRLLTAICHSPLNKTSERGCRVAAADFKLRRALKTLVEFTGGGGGAPKMASDDWNWFDQMWHHKLQHIRGLGKVGTPRKLIRNMSVWGCVGSHWRKFGTLIFWGFCGRNMFENISDCQPEIIRCDMGNDPITLNWSEMDFVDQK